MKWLSDLLDFLAWLLTPAPPAPPPTTTTPKPTTTTTTPKPPPTTTPPTTTTTTRPPGTPLDAVRQALLDAHNRARQTAGLAPLLHSGALNASAQGHADWMAATGNLSHTGSGGSSAGQRISATGYRWSRAGENIAKGYATVESVMADWMLSSGHRSNILGRYFNVGFGIAKRGTVTYWAVNFATPATPGIAGQYDDCELVLSGPLVGTEEE